MALQDFLFNSIVKKMRSNALLHCTSLSQKECMPLLCRKKALAPLSSRLWTGTTECNGWQSSAQQS